ncbi:hypothetical protein H2202_000506 [Exophiala xenobiotica]|nr:hypothetical protein H2202_000506 [Exophiala xenobiotica]KAK5233635.1 hypothetical protein LTR47_005258 [Exophiala xenobiotica]KAK5246877.1 hypothetical protein LTS06_007883 [Exophiala xenobiotica]KAK5356788.1 hypothetical protein LTR61_000523 [Exophiala xenobiotica]KAK5376940.1 hypothetical protein LTR11_004604 [Exophiala xenobiotica]
MKAMAAFKTNITMPVMTFVAILLYVLPANAFFRHLCFGELANGRIDPIMSPGLPSQHLHVTFGASNLGLDSTIEELLASNCTSCSITQDHSAYWAPRMYFQHSNGTLQMVPTSGGMTVYYFTEGPGAGWGENVTAFPQNFRMIAGMSPKRAFYGPQPGPPMSLWQDSDRTQQSLMEKAVGFNCLHYDTSPNEGALEVHYMRNKTFLDETCTDGIRAEMMFPSCWNGKDLDSQNHTTHIAYPYEIKYGDCPPDYPVRLPVLFYETIYQTNLFKGIDGQFVFANGDPTGYGYHGDFICGWDEGVLQQAINNAACTNPTSSGLQEDCPIFNLQNQANATQCKLEMPEVLQNESINYIQQLPGGIQIQYGPEPATMPGAASSASQVANSTVSPTPATPTPGPTASTSPTTSNVITPMASLISDAQSTMTSTYMSNGVEVHMVVVEEVVTVTVSNEATPTGERRRRHLHKHAHNHSGRRLH